MSLAVTRLAALSDNYVYLIRDEPSGKTALVDPAEAEPALAALAARGWGLDFILNTHHHGDHVGGNRELKAKTGAKVVGPAADRDRIPEIDIALADGASFDLGGARATVFDVPGHTRGHIAFWFASAKALFCGDTLFSLGCGRMFEGTAEQMWASLARLRALPDDTAVYCAHEYTASNARFALAVDPDNAALQKRVAEVTRLRAAGEATVPSRLGEEKAANPFLRADDPALAAAIGQAKAPPSRVFAELRGRKDNFR